MQYQCPHCGGIINIPDQHPAQAKAISQQALPQPQHLVNSQKKAQGVVNLPSIRNAMEQPLVNNDGVAQGVKNVGKMFQYAGIGMKKAFNAITKKKEKTKEKD